MKTITIHDPEQIREIIAHCPYCMVGLIDDNNHPYVIPMNFAFEADRGKHGTIYLHSGPEGGKLNMVTQRPEVCLTFCEGHELVYMHQQIACSYSMKSRSVVCRGKVGFIHDLEEKRRFLELMMKQYTDNECRMAEPALRNVVVWEVPVEELSCRSFGLRPSELK